MRKMGDVLLDLEKVLLEMNDHELQYGDILALVYSYMEIHMPGAKEEYLDGTHPKFYYGHVLQDSKPLRKRKKVTRVRKIRLR